MLIFLLNSIHGSRERACVAPLCTSLDQVELTTLVASSLLLGTGKAGAAILDRLMTIVSVLFEDETAEGIASEEFHSDIFQLSCVSFPTFAPLTQTELTRCAHVSRSFAIVQQLIELEAFAPAYEEHAL